MIVIMRRCDHCKLTFHKPTAEEGTEGCECRLFGCGCRLKREQKEAT